MLDLNFTEIGNSTVKVEVYQHIYNYSKTTKTPLLLLSTVSPVAQIQTLRPDKDSEIQAALTLGYMLHVLINTVGWLSLALVVFAIFFDIDLLAPMVEFIRMTKPISRFKYINVRCGGIIEGFLANYHDLFRIAAFMKTDKSVTYSVVSRNRLLRYHLPVFTFTTIPDKYIIYGVISADSVTCICKATSK